MSDRTVDLFLPRFRIDWGSVNLRAKLTALGMPLAFTRFQADFSGINGREPRHAEAAAATAVVSAPSSGRGRTKLPPVPIFRADHPFLFAIRDRKSGAILFLGRMADSSR
jgi:serpin B